MVKSDDEPIERDETEQHRSTRGLSSSHRFNKTTPSPCLFTFRCTRSIQRYLLSHKVKYKDSHTRITMNRSSRREWRLSGMSVVVRMAAAKKLQFYTTHSRDETKQVLVGCCSTDRSQSISMLHSSDGHCPSRSGRVDVDKYDDEAEECSELPKP